MKWLYIYNLLLACGVGLAAIYERVEPLVEIVKRSNSETATVVGIVCGGNMVSLRALNEWKEMFNLD